jgi:5-methylcytosine-specific restriction endonuclease McrA
MISIKDFNDATLRKRSDMLKSCKARYWKSGKRAGTVRRVARDLPFTLEEFRVWAMKEIGLGLRRCYYCPRPIDILNFQPDHYIPKDLGGSLGLENLVPSCEDCNRLKGAMPPGDFMALLEFLERKMSYVGRMDVIKRMKAGGKGLRCGWIKDQKAVQSKSAKPVPTGDELTLICCK